MAQKAQITIRVYSSASATKVQYTSAGRYRGFQTAGYLRTLPGLPILPTASNSAFWQAAIALVVADIQANP